VTDDPRAHLLRAAVGFVLVPPTEPELRLLHCWLDWWPGVLNSLVRERGRYLP